ncbi:MAG: 1-acyl-sn-glycerol-3-phosphate acyltransferase [Bacteroidales bacterium]
MISGYILKYLLGWEIKGEFPDVKKSIIIFAPHTSYMDALYGKLAVIEFGIKYKFISKKKLFFFPLNIAMKLYGSISVGGVNNNNTIHLVSQMFNNARKLHIIISPEGTRKKVTKWNKGFYSIALRTNVPIVVGYIDYGKKEIGIKGIIDEIKDIDTVMQQINLLYKGVTAKYPDKFSLELVN